MSTICNCKVYTNLNKRRLTSSGIEQAVDKSGVLSLVSMAKFTSSEFVASFHSIDDFASPDAFSQSIIVILLLVILWVGGLFLIFICGRRRNILKKKIDTVDNETERKIKSAAVSHSPIAICNNLQEYISEIFPSVYSTKLHIHRLVDEVKRHHRYLNILTLSQGDFGEKTRVLIGLQLLTVQTMLIFLLAVFYDLQCPSNDNSCIEFYTQESCLSRKTYIDQSQTYCTWIAPSPQFESAVEDNNYPCVYQDPTFTLQVMLYIAILVSLITSVFLRPIDMVFDLLSSPIADSEKVKNVDTTVKRIGRRVSNAARRVSMVASNTASAIINKIGIRKNLSVGSRTILIPTSTKSAQSVASAAMPLISFNIEKNLQNFQQRQLINKKELKANFLNQDDMDSNSSHSNNSNKYYSFPVNTQSEHLEPISKDISASTKFSVLNMNTNDVLIRLLDDINCQRKYLKSTQLDIFDKEWGIDGTGEFTRGGVGVKSSCFKSIRGAEENIRKEIECVKKITNEKFQKLDLATDEHIGVEMMHLFILDLLGRETPAARIFEVKAKEDFIQTKVVTKTTKILCYIFLFLLNIFFAFYTILRGYSKGFDWQYTFLIACISQLLVEIILFETVECIWIQFFVPNLVSTEVTRVNTILMDIIKDLVVQNDKIETENIILDAPEYLFVSTNLAKKYSNLMESFIILSYHSYLPGELFKKWQSGSTSRIRRHDQFHLSLLLSTMVIMLQVLVTLPFVIQRMFVRFTQPFFLFGLIYLGTLIMDNIIYTIIISLVLFLIVIYFIYIYFFKKKPKLSTSPISPLEEDTTTVGHVNNIIIDDEIGFVDLTNCDDEDSKINLSSESLYNSKNSFTQSSDYYNSSFVSNSFTNKSSLNSYINSSRNVKSESNYTDSFIGNSDTIDRSEEQHSTKDSLLSLDNNELVDNYSNSYSDLYSRSDRYYSNNNSENSENDSYISSYSNITRSDNYENNTRSEISDESKSGSYDKSDTIGSSYNNNNNNNVDNKNNNEGGDSSLSNDSNETVNKSLNESNQSDYYSEENSDY